MMMGKASQNRNGLSRKSLYNAPSAGHSQESAMILKQMRTLDLKITARTG